MGADLTLSLSPSLSFHLHLHLRLHLRLRLRLSLSLSHSHTPFSSSAAAWHHPGVERLQEGVLLRRRQLPGGLTLASRHPPPQRVHAPPSCLLPTSPTHPSSAHLRRLPPPHPNLGTRPRNADASCRAQLVFKMRMHVFTSQVVFPAQADTLDRANLLGATVLLDFSFFETQNQV